MSTNDTKPKRVIDFHAGGAHRATEAVLPHIANFNAKSTEFLLAPHLADIVPGRAEKVHNRAQSLGIPGGSWTEASIERVLDHGVLGPVSLHVDSPLGHVNALSAAKDANVAAIALLLIRFGPGALASFTAALAPDDVEGHCVAALFLTTMAAVTVRGSRAAETFAGAELAEAELRSSFAKVFGDELPRLASSTPVHSAPLTITRPGREPARLVVLEPQDSPRTPSRLVDDTFDVLPATRRGSDLVVAELLDREVVLHDVRLRSDSRLAIHGVPLLGESQAQASAHLQRATEEALSRATRLARITPRDAALASD